MEPMSLYKHFSRHGIFKLFIIILFFISIPANALSWIPVKRKVLILYNSELSQTPEDNFAYMSCQSILNYYGILADYRDISQRPLPDSKIMSDYRGIITIFNSNKMQGAKDYFIWLNKQFDAKRKVVVLGELGGTDNLGLNPVLNKLINKTYRNLGLEYGYDFTTNQSLISYAFIDKNRVEFERKYPVFVNEYEKFKPIHKNIKTYLAIKRKDKKDSTSSLIITSSTGGFARSGFFFWEDTITNRKKWYLNPFIFFEEALNLKALPRPDPTTLNGLRVAFSHIDGDSFSGFSRVADKSVCAKIIKEHILEKYDFPVTVSVIVGDIDPKALGNPHLVQLAKEIFNLPNVEPASHTYSHPFYWDPQDLDKRYARRYGILIPGYSFDPKKEIDYSMKYITKELSPQQKPCQILLWSGNCMPTASDIDRCDNKGFLNLNGGDTIFDDYNNSYTSIRPLYRNVEGRYQFYVGQANENILTNLWKGPHFGYRNIITTMEKTEHPKRIKPIDIYSHFYSAEYHSSIKALQDVYQWVLKQNIAPVFTSEYLKMAKGFIQTRIKSNKDYQYSIEDYGHCLTIRFDTKDLIPDMLLCKNVLGYTQEPQGLYVSLVPGKKKAIISLSKGSSSSFPDKKIAHIKKASGWVTDFRTEDNMLKLTYKGFGRGMIEINGLEANEIYNINGSALRHKNISISTDDVGNLAIKEIETGTLEINQE